MPPYIYNTMSISLYAAVTLTRDSVCAGSTCLDDAVIRLSLASTSSLWITTPMRPKTPNTDPWVCFHVLCIQLWFCVVLKYASWTSLHFCVRVWLWCQGLIHWIVVLHGLVWVLLMCQKEPTWSLTSTTSRSPWTMTSSFAMSHR